MQFTEMMESKKGGLVVLLSFNLDQKEMLFDKIYKHLEIRGEFKARELSTQRYLGFKTHRLGEIGLIMPKNRRLGQGVMPANPRG